LLSLARHLSILADRWPSTGGAATVAATGRSLKGFLGYLLTYQLFMSPVSVAGYFQELFGARGRW
jgi:hypothetical protein